MRLAITLGLTEDQSIEMLQTIEDGKYVSYLGLELLDNDGEGNPTRTTIVRVPFVRGMTYENLFNQLTLKDHALLEQDDTIQELKNRLGVWIRMGNSVVPPIGKMVEEMRLTYEDL
jgi:hypothetical protein